MSSVTFGQWRCSRERSRPIRALIAATAVFFIPAAPFAQDSAEFNVPILDLEADALLMAEMVEAKVTFVDPTGIGAESALQIGATDADLAFRERVTIAPEAPAGGAKSPSARSGSKTAASLNVRTAPGQPITIHIDEVVTSEGYSLADFRCNYNAGDEMACDGEGFSQISVATGKLFVGATLIADGNGIPGPADGSFDITISYQ